MMMKRGDLSHILQRWCNLGTHHPTTTTGYRSCQSQRQQAQKMIKRQGCCKSRDGGCVVAQRRRRLLVQPPPPKRFFTTHHDAPPPPAAASPTAASSQQDSALKAVSGQLTQLIKDPKSLEQFSKELTPLQRQRLPNLVASAAHKETIATTSPFPTMAATNTTASTTTTTTTTAAAAAAPENVPKPSRRDLQLVIMNTSIPFIGFGIMDNAILILAGDAIDHSLGVWLGISTMCAAAIGNIVSDVAGVMLGTAVEDFCARYLRLPVPSLSTAQRQLQSVRFANQLGCALGLVVGCIIGMFPLLLLDSNHVQARKRQVALDHMFQDVINEAASLVNAQRTRLYIVCRRPQDDNNTTLPNKNNSNNNATTDTTAIDGSTTATASGSSTTTDSKRRRSFMFVGGNKRTGLVLPTAQGDYLYAKYSKQIPSHPASSSSSHKHGKGGGVGGHMLDEERWIPLGRGIVSRAALTGDVWNIENVNEEPDYRRDIADASHDFEPRNMLCVPVMDGNGNTIAVLQALNKMATTTNNNAEEQEGEKGNQSSSSAPSFTDSDVQIFQALASHISVSLQRMYYEAAEEGATEEEHSLKTTIQILKDSGLVILGQPFDQAGMHTTATTGGAVRQPLFPDD